MDYREIFSVTLILFSIIDILGAIPSIILIRQREGRIHAEAATIISAFSRFTSSFNNSITSRTFILQSMGILICGTIIFPTLVKSGLMDFITPGLTVAIWGRFLIHIIVAIRFPPKAGRVCLSNLVSLSISSTVQSAVSPVFNFEATLGAAG